MNNFYAVGWLKWITVPERKERGVGALRFFIGC